MEVGKLLKEQLSSAKQLSDRALSIRCQCGKEAVVEPTNNTERGIMPIYDFRAY